MKKPKKAQQATLQGPNLPAVSFRGSERKPRVKLNRRTLHVRAWRFSSGLTVLYKIWILPRAKPNNLSVVSESDCCCSTDSQRTLFRPSHFALYSAASAYCVKSKGTNPSIQDSVPFISINHLVNPSSKLEESLPV